MTEKHLWEVDHPYYCEETNFFARDQHFVYANWGDFIESTGAVGWDLDRNLLFRWDWNQHEDSALGTLDLFWMLQRKGAYCSHSVTVHRDDEPAVRAFLAPRAARMASLWLPLLLDAEADAFEEPT